MSPRYEDLTPSDIARIATAIGVGHTFANEDAHVSDDALIRYVKSEARDDEAIPIELHVGICDGCRDKISRLHQLDQTLISNDYAKLRSLRLNILRAREQKFSVREAELEQMANASPAIAYEEVPRTPVVRRLGCAVQRSIQAISDFGLATILALFDPIAMCCRLERRTLRTMRTVAICVLVLGAVLILKRDLQHAEFDITKTAYPRFLQMVSYEERPDYLYKGSESSRNHGVDSLNKRWFYGQEDRPFNHGFPSGFFASDPSVLSKIHVTTECVYDASAPDLCSDDPSALDRARGSVLRITFAALSPGQFAGLNFEEPDDYSTLRYGPGYDLRGVQTLTFNAVSPASGTVVQFGVGGKPGRPMAIPSRWKHFSVDISSFGLSNEELSDVHILFTVAADHERAAKGATVLMDDIRFEPAPKRIAPVLGLPASYQTFGIVPVSAVLPGRVPIPVDQVNRNLSTLYESALAVMSLVNRGNDQDLRSAKVIADSLLWALAHDAQGDPIPIAPDGSRGLHNGYSSGDLALYNIDGSEEVRLSGFSAGSSLCGPSQFCLVLDGATGGNNAFAALALVKQFATTGDQRYLDTASEIGNWIYGNLFDASPSGLGGYFVGYPDKGQIPKVLQRGKSTENNADIFAAFSALERAEDARGNVLAAAMWRARAYAAGDFVMKMFDDKAGRFYAGTTRKEISHHAGLVSGDDVIVREEFIDANTIPTLALSGSDRYRHQIDWRRPVSAAATFARTVQAGGRRFQGVSLVRHPTSGPDGIAWEFTAQLVSAMRQVDELYREDSYRDKIRFFLSEIRNAQTLAPYGDGEGIVAATLQNGDLISPYEQCLSTPYQCIPERVALAATTWSIFAEQGVNPFEQPKLSSRRNSDPPKPDVPKVKLKVDASPSLPTYAAFHTTMLSYREYRWVVAIEACPKTSCTTRMSEPKRRSSVATVWRSMWGMTRLSMPARLAMQAITRASPWLEVLFPREFRKTASLSTDIDRRLTSKQRRDNDSGDLIVFRTADICQQTPISSRNVVA